ncbi:arsenate reductase (glutaredoxin) [Flavobacteriaceae bacterium]|nr:arsenate reductase (glutaredoxin) [Flavobacteriaceae bacterium]
MIKIYHNPRCTKSRQGLAYLEERSIQPEIIKYLDRGLTTEELKDILSKLNYSPLELIRKNEAIWKSDYKGKELSDQQIIQSMVNHPKLMERPIIINGNKAVVGRPTEKIEEIL